MKGKIMISLLLCIFLISPSSASLFTDLSTYVVSYNENVDQVPDGIKLLISGERVHGIVDLTDGNVSEMLMVIGESGSIDEFNEITPGTDVSPTLIIKTNENTINTILSSENPGEAFLNAYDTGDIEIDGVGIIKTVTLAIGSIILKIGNILGIFG